MSDEWDDTTPDDGRPARIALVLVPGVGEEEPSQTATSLAKSLTGRLPAYEWGPAETLDVHVHGQGRHEVHRRTLFLDREGDRHRIDLHEMRWSDLSSFPTGLMAFVISLFGFGLQLATVGLEAIQGQLRRRPADVGDGLAGPARWCAEAASWITAAIVVPLTLVTAVVAVAFWLVVVRWLALPDWLVVLVVGVAGALLVLRLGRGIREGGWAYGGDGWSRLLDPRWWAVAMLAAVVGVGAWQYAETGAVRMATAHTLLWVVAVGLRGAWLAALTVIVVTLVLLALSSLSRRRRLDPRAWVTGVLTTTISPLVVAMVGALLFAGIAGVAFQSADSARWGADAPQLRCLDRLSSWVPGDDCGPSGDAWPDAARAIAAETDDASRLRDEASATRTRAIDGTLDPIAGGRAADDLTQRADASARVARDLERAAGATPVQWAQHLFTAVIFPFAGAFLGILLVLVAMGVTLGVTALLVRRAHPGPAGRPVRQGRAIARVSRWGSHQGTSWFLLVLAMAGSFGAWLCWTGVGSATPLIRDLTSGSVWDSARGTLFAVFGGVTVALLVVGRLAPIDPRRPSASIGGALNGARKVIDPIYDIATYLRIDHGGGIRTRIVGRYRAILRTIRRGHYDAVVVVAHSQGTALSAAVLFGDEHRRDPEPGPPGSRPWGVRPWDEPRPAPATALVTCACPLRHMYNVRLPGEYEALWVPGDDPDTMRERLGFLTHGWINAYRARDPIGRAVFNDPRDEDTLHQGRVWRHPGGDVAGGLELRDVCVVGPGGHTGYWDDPQVALWVDYAVRRVMGAAGERVDLPTGYEPA
ncbi:MAG: hypothetical protein AB7V42_14090 [Thermoleophilia bacterium]